VCDDVAEAQSEQLNWLASQKARANFDCVYELKIIPKRTYEICTKWKIIPKFTLVDLIGNVRDLTHADSAIDPLGSCASPPLLSPRPISSTRVVDDPALVPPTLHACVSHRVLLESGVKSTFGADMVENGTKICHATRSRQTDPILPAQQAHLQTMSLTELQLRIASPPTSPLHPSSSHPAVPAICGSAQVWPARSY
jgi:hypothetical protein